MDYSVVIPAFNRQHTIAASIESVLSQTAPPIEVILVDDGSTDATVSVARDVDPSIQVLSTEGRRGACFARNLGAAHAKTGWIAFQDSDDVWMPTKQQKFCDVIRTFDVTAAFGAFFAVSDNRRAVAGLPLDPRDRVADCVLSLNSTRGLLQQNCVSTQTLMLTKQRLDQAGGFNPKLRRFQDWDLAIRLVDQGSLAFVHEPLVVVQQQENSLSRNFEAGLESRYHFLSAYAERYQRDPDSTAAMLQDIALRELASMKPHRAAIAALRSLGNRIRSWKGASKS